LNDTGPLIRVTELTKNYGSTTALQGLDLQIAKGEIFGILGPNGAGKTTLIRILATLTRQSSGQAFVGGYDVMQQPVRAKQRIGVVHQTLNIDPELTAEESLRIHGMLFGLSRSVIRRRSASLLEFVGLAEKRHQVLDAFSGGMKRRLTIVRAMMHEPEVLILDEPTVGLDAHARRTVWDLIRRLRQRGSTILVTTHYIAEAEQLADRVAIIDNGKLIALGSPKALIEQIGRFAVDILDPNRTESRFFQHQTEAAAFLAKIEQEAVVRPATLEDVFISLTGKTAVFKDESSDSQVPRSEP